MPRKTTLEDFVVDEISLDDNVPVPNEHPAIRSVSYRLAIIGEAPGADEVRERRPFVGHSGRLLNGILSRTGIPRAACFIGNVCQVRPPGNDINNFPLDGPQIQNGLLQLQLDLDSFRPNICLLLGKTALWAAKHAASIGDWRGSLFVGEKPPFLGRKCIAAYHPAACLRKYDWTPLLAFDVRKAYNDATRPELILPERQLVVDLTAEEIIQQLEKFKVSKPLLSIDIEGYVDRMSCLSIAPSDSFSFIIRFAKRNGESYYDLDTETNIWRHLSSVLADATIPKVLQNSLYDRFVLQYSYDCPIVNVIDDTMLKHHELYCELEKSLGFQASLYTHEPFYKSDRETDDPETFWRYCCRDSAVTYEINSKLDKWLGGTSRLHYDFNIAMLNPLLYMELRGFLYDKVTAAKKLAEIEDHYHAFQHELNVATGHGFPESATKGELLAAVQQEICYKRDPNRAKKGYEADFVLARNLLTTPTPLTPAQLGYLSITAKRDLNIKSAAFKKYLYEKLELPIQRDPQTGSVTTDYEALLILTKHTKHPAVQLAIDISELRTRSQMLSISADRDGRIRCGYNVVGTKTGRITCYTSPTGSGYNLQTIPANNPLKPVGHPLRNGMRSLFTADPGYYLFQADLSGADGWTIGAHMARLGDSTMLDDLRAGLKPARIVCYMLRHGDGAIRGKPREEITELIKEVHKEDWDYFACKQGIWGTCYLMGPRKLATVVLLQSEGAVNMSESEVREFQRIVFLRYRVDKVWHPAMSRFLSQQPYPPKLTAASGLVRKFFGRSQEILGEALAHEPQANTTYATNKAVLRLWSDSENRRTNDKGDLARTLLRIEPIHQVHDALVGQFKIEDTTWALPKIKSYFDNPLTIAGISLTIPFEGSYGTNWEFDSQSKVGSI